MSWNPLRRASAVAARRQRSGFATYMGVLWGVQALVLAGLYGVAWAGGKVGQELVAPPPAIDEPRAPTHVIRLSLDEVRVDGHRVGSLDALAAEPGPVIGTLLDALPRPASHGEGVVIECDKRVTFSMVKRVMATARAAGYDDLAFAALTP